jgi:uncharacterized membrane protein (DUF485 family)
MDDPNGRAIDWVRLESLPEFRELVAKRRRFVLPATAFFLTWYFGFIVLAGYAPDFMGEEVVDGLTIGYVLALSQFAMVAILGLWYLRYAERVLDPLRDEIALIVGEPAVGEQAEERRAAHTPEREGVR